VPGSKVTFCGSPAILDASHDGKVVLDVFEVEAIDLRGPLMIDGLLTLLHRVRFSIFSVELTQK
jgi:hypothetical protein